MDLDDQIAKQKIEDTNKLIGEFDDLDFKFKIKRGVEMNGYLIQVAVVAATVLGLVSVLGGDIFNNPLAIGGVIFLAISVVGGLFYPLYSTETGIISANDAHKSIQQKNFRVLEIWHAVARKEKTVLDGEKEHLAIAKEGIENPWITTVKRDRYVWVIFACFTLGIILLVSAMICSNFYDKFSGHHQKHHLHELRF